MTAAGTSVDNLGNVNVAKSGLTSLKTALSKVQTNAKMFATDVKSAFPSQTTALKIRCPARRPRSRPRRASLP